MNSVSFQIKLLLVHIACRASVSIGLSAGSKNFSLFECAKIGVSAKKCDKGTRAKKCKKSICYYYYCYYLLLLLLLLLLLYIFFFCAHPNFCTAKKPKILKRVEKPLEMLALQATTCSSYCIAELQHQNSVNNLITVYLMAIKLSSEYLHS